MPGRGRLTLHPSVGEELTFLVVGEPSRTGGAGGWVTIERALLPDVHDFKSTPRVSESWPVMLDIDELPGPSIEARLARLHRMGTPRAETDEPPRIRISGDISPLDRSLRWKLDDVNYGRMLFDPDDPDSLRRITMTLEISELEKVDTVSPVKIHRTRRTSGKRRQRTIRTKSGDTLRSIAVRQLGSSTQWRKIREWNKNVKRADPDAPLRPGTRILLK